MTTSIGATKDYNFIQKEHWRRMVWNRVVTHNKQEGVVIYLAGSDNHDLRIAKEKGIDELDCIAVDRDIGNVNRLKSLGYLAIQADAHNVLWSWPFGHPVKAVLFDLCNGIAPELSSLCDPFQQHDLWDALLMVNLLRGRDPKSAKHKEAIGQIFKEEDVKFLNGFLGVQDIQKHRAALFMLMEWLQQLHLVSGNDESLLSANKDGLMEIRFPRYFLALLPAIAKSYDYRFSSYPSGKLIMDSVVCVPPYGKAAKQYKLSTSFYDKTKMKFHDEELSRRIVALMAVRSRRKNERAQTGRSRRAV